VLSAIQFHDQALFVATEIRDKVADRVLTAEFCASDLPPSQAKP
jgi:hypothetical protein